MPSPRDPANPQTKNVRFIGLVTAPNALSVADGALSLAENVDIDDDNIVESRRGAKVYGDTTIVAVSKMISWKDKLFIHRSTTLERDSDDAGNWVAYAGIQPPPTGFLLKSAQANRNLYFTTSAGIKKLDSLIGTVVQLAGVPKGLDLNLTLVAGTILPDLKAVAYRIVWTFTDANTNLILGTPSQRVEIFNTSGSAKNISLNFSIPSGITTAHTYQVYRSKAVPTTAAGGPSDELQLAFESNPTAGEITAKVITVTDAIIEAVLSTFLYTNSSQEGIAQTNDEPPLAVDITTHKGHTFYANTKTKQKLVTNLLAVGATLGIQIDDTITVAGVVLTGKAVESAAAGQFLISVLASPADAIEETALSIVKVLNRFATNTVVNAFYGSGVDDPPGQIVVEHRLFSDTTFTFTSSRTTAFTPVTSVSTNLTKQNRVYISKSGRPEGVPSSNFLDIGSADKSIERILALKDALFILKKDGVFFISGDSPSNFRVQEHDPNVFIRGRETAVVFVNHIYMMSNQGVVAIDENGVVIKSREIEDKILMYNSPLFASFDTRSFAVAYESDRKYILFVPTVAADTSPTIAYVLNTITGAWTTWLQARTAGIVSTRDDKLYLASALNTRVYQERKNFALSDHADDEFAVTITSSTGVTVNMVSTASVVVGQTLKQSFREARVLAVVTGSQITVDRVETWVVAAATVFNPIACKIRWKIEDVDSPGMVKEFTDVIYFFKEAAVALFKIGFATNFFRTELITDIAASVLTGFGEVPFGEDPFGGEPTGTLEVRTYPPVECSRGLWLIMSLATTQAFTKFSSAGMSISTRAISEKF